MRGLVAFSFAQRSEAEEPGPCNVRLADAVATIVASEDEPVVVVAQWEVGRRLAQLGVKVDHVVDQKSGDYLDSEHVWEEAENVFRTLGIHQVTPVAQPFLHLAKVKRLITRAGFGVIERPIGKIGFDPSSRNRQWWTKGPFRLLSYGVMQLLTGHRGAATI